MDSSSAARKERARWRGSSLVTRKIFSFPFAVNRRVEHKREKNEKKWCKNEQRSIVNVASIAGKEGNPMSLGKELAKFDIGVNCITPAAARTGLFEQMTESHIRYMLSKIPRERFVEVGEIASMVAWLVSAENSFTTGAVFDISGGRATY